MAELHVEPKKHNSSTWIWILVSLAVVAIIAYFLLRDNKAGDNNMNRNTTSFIQGFNAQAYNNSLAA
jgi:bacteriorhodopsin